MNMNLSAGTIVHGVEYSYEIIRTLGAGGFGITYLVKARNSKGEEILMALKEHFLSGICERDNATQSVVYSDPLGEKVNNSMRDFLSEAKRLSRLDILHAHLIRIYESFEANNTAYYSMDYIQGDTLAEYVGQRGALSQGETMKIMRAVLSGVAVLHANGLTHLDIKPQNILIENNDITRPVLIDFGLAKHYDVDGNPTSTILTQGVSEGYSPIEQYGGISKFSPTADVYAAAATILYCLTGKRPPSSITAIDVKIFGHIPANITAGFRKLLIASLSSNPEIRPKDAMAFLDYYVNPDKIQTPNQHGSDTVPISQNNIKQKIIKIGAIVCSLLLVAGIIFIAIKLNHNNSAGQPEGESEQEVVITDTLAEKLSTEPAAYSLAVNYKNKEYYVSDQQWNNLSFEERGQLAPKGVVMGESPNYYIIDMEDTSGGDTWRNALQSTDNNLPYEWMATATLNKLSTVNEALEKFGGKKIVGEYWTKERSTESDKTARYFSTQLMELGGEYCDDSHFYRVRKFLPIEKNIPVDLSKFRSVPENLDLQVYFNNKPYYISQSDYNTLSADEKKSLRKIGVVVIGKSACVIDLFDESGAYTMIESVSFNLPSKIQYEDIIRNFDAVQKVLKVFGGQPFTFDETYPYWSATVNDPKESSTFILTPCEYGGAVIESWRDDEEARVRQAHYLKRS